MRIIIIGSNQLTGIIAKYSVEDGHDLVIIDKNEEAINAITEKFDVNGIVGNPISKETLLNAGADSAELMIAITDDEVLNIMCCIEAKRLGTRKTISRTRSVELCKNSEIEFINSIANIDMTINVEESAAEEIMRMISFPEVTRYEKFANDKVELAEFCAPAQLDGVVLKDLSNIYPNKVLICTILRNKEIIIPNGSFKIEKDDFISITAPHLTIVDFLNTIGINSKTIKNVMLVGCGRTGQYLTKKLIDEKINTTIIEANIDSCSKLKELFPKARIVLGKGSEADLLTSEGIDKAGACISLTDSDETNMVVSLFAYSKGVKNIFTRINDASFLPILNNSKIDYTVSPSLITANYIFRYIRSLENLFKYESRSLKKLNILCNGSVQALEFVVEESFSKKDILFSSPNFSIKKNTIIASIIRENNIIYPNGTSCLCTGDTVIVITTNSSISKLDDAFVMKS